MNQYDEFVSILERKELETPSSDANLYAKLMAYYLVQNKLVDAKFLWSRIPQNIKTESIQLQKLNELRKSISSNNIADVFKNIERTEWSEEIKILMDDLKVITMQNVFQLIGNAYTSIWDKTLLEITNHNEEQFEPKCLELDWTIERSDQQLVIHPKKQVCTANNKSDSEYLLSKLTEFVSFLEN